MSKPALLSPDEAAHAAASGWQLVHVADARTSALSVDILPLKFGGKWPNREAAVRHVIATAKFGDGVAQKALQIIVSSNQSR